ncbi:hypothetical protein SAMN05444745_1118 [Arthrobacter sp. OV608]|nr:hypothetical protein SAMN05444745_1118 [Arthrobacter sp. OV608]
MQPPYADQSRLRPSKSFVTQMTTARMDEKKVLTVSTP